jgi:ACS family pantothenate transporter-like MFS transporter
MREELGFKGNQLNQINTVFTVGYTIAQVPCNIALYYIKPRIFFPACMVSSRSPTASVQMLIPFR